MSRRKASHLTRKLSTANCSVVVRSSRRSYLWLLPVVVILAVLVYLFNPGSAREQLRASVSSLQHDNELLQKQLKEQTLNFEHERAVRESLQRELAQQGEELKKVQKDLAFYRTNLGHAKK